MLEKVYMKPTIENATPNVPAKRLNQTSTPKFNFGRMSDDLGAGNTKSSLSDGKTQKQKVNRPLFPENQYVQVDVHAECNRDSEATGQTHLLQSGCHE